MAADKDDRQLVRAARSGDARAFEELVRRHQARVYGLVRRMTSADDVAEELTQDVFVRAYRGLEGFRERSAFSTWIYRIAVNRVRDYRESRASRDREMETSLEAAIGSLPDPVARTPGPDDALSETEIMGRFSAAVDALEAHLRDAFLLRHQENLQYDAIAEVLRISRPNAKVRVHRARERVLQTLRDAGYEV